MCKFYEDGDFGHGNCLLDGESCDYEDGEDDCITFEPSEYDVLNGYFEDDPIGFKMWNWENRGCPKCRTSKIEKSVERIEYLVISEYLCLTCNHKEKIED